MRYPACILKSVKVGKQWDHSSLINIYLTNGRCPIDWSFVLIHLDEEDNTSDSVSL